MQVDPIKPTLKAPGIKLLSLKYDKPLSNFGFKFNLRRYIKAVSIGDKTNNILGGAVQVDKNQNPSLIRAVRIVSALEMKM